MPFYDYKCSKCGKVFEVLHGMNGKPAGLKCEFCGSDNIQRVFHPVGTRKSGEDFPVPTSSGSSCSSCSSASCSACG